MRALEEESADLAAICDAVKDEMFVADLEQAIEDFHQVDIESLSYARSP